MSWLQCLTCGAAVRGLWPRFCPRCGTRELQLQANRPSTRACQVCRRVVPFDARFCPACHVRGDRYLSIEPQTPASTAFPRAVDVRRAVGIHTPAVAFERGRRQTPVAGGGIGRGRVLLIQCVAAVVVVAVGLFVFSDVPPAAAVIVALVVLRAVFRTPR